MNFNGNGNTGGGMASETFTYGVSKALTLNGFTRTGYTFAGWGTSAGGPVVYTNGQSITVTANETLYAQWTAIKTNTSTTLSLNTSSATYGNEGGVVYTVGVDPSVGNAHRHGDDPVGLDDTVRHHTRQRRGTLQRRSDRRCQPDRS